MLKIIDNLKPFFEDNYKRINVREFAKIQNISPPTSSKLLEEFNKKKLLSKEVDKINNYYFANMNSSLFIDLSRIYWKIKLEKCGLINVFQKELIVPVVILFGSLSKAEVRQDSDIDIAIFSITSKKFDLDEFEKKLKRKIQVFTFKDRKSIKNKELLNNILNGYKLIGNW